MTEKGSGRGPKAADEEVHRVEPATEVLRGWVQEGPWPLPLAPEQNQDGAKDAHQALQGFVGDAEECEVCVVEII